MFYKHARVYSTLAQAAARSSGHIVQIDTGVRRVFAAFMSLQALEDWYRRLSPIDRTLSEVVRQDTRKLVLDVDNPPPDVAALMWMYDFERHITSRIAYIFNKLDIGSPNVIVYDICDCTTISYHVVVSNFSFSAATCRGLCHLISAGQVWEALVDTGVYKRTQNIRMEGSTKYGERRWKQRCGADSCEPSPNFVEGLISVTSNTIKDRISIECSTASDTLRTIQNTRESSVWTHNFKIRKAIKGCIYLERTNPGLCIQCKRVHTSENAIITEHSGFLCWRYIAENGF